MQKTVYIFSLLLFCYYTAQGQCENNVSTNPSAPSNNALPDDTTGGAPYDMDDRFLNGMNWWTPSTYYLDNMEFNPDQPYLTMTNIQSSGVGSAYSYLNKHASSGIAPEEMNWENGWELLLSNLGRYPDDLTLHSNIEFQNVPYLVFYHRYKSIIRVFVRYGYNTFPNDAIDGVKINLYYDRNTNQNNVSGIFRLGDGLDRTLDQETKVDWLSTIAPPNGQAHFWLSSDFQIAYDPCVCQYPTDIRLDFEYFSTTSLKLYGRGITTNENIIDANGNINNLDFLSGVDFSSQQSAENGFVIYKNMVALADDYINKMVAYETNLAAAQQHNAEVERNLVIIRVFRKAVNAGLTALTGSSELADLALKAPQFYFNPNSASDSIQRRKFFKKVEQILGKELDLYISENFKKKPDPKQPSMPTAAFSEMYFEGILENNLLINGPFFSTPGSFVNEGPNTLNVPADVYSYPIYNEPLGVFALLEKPKVKISYQDVAENCSVYDSDEITVQLTGPPNVSFENRDVDYIHAKVDKQLQIALDGDLKYTFNTALPIASKSVDASFKVYTSIKPGIGTVSTNYPFGEVDLYTWTYLKNNPFHSVNIESEAINIDSDDYFFVQQNLLQTENKDLIYNTIYTPIDALKSSVYALGYTTEFVFPKHHITSPHNWHDGVIWSQARDYHNEWSASMFSSCSAWGSLGVMPRLREFNPRNVQVDSVFLKLMVSITFDDLKDDGITPHEYTYSFTYKINPEDIDHDFFVSPIFSNLSGSSLDITQFQENLLLDGINFNGNPITGCKLNGTTYLCKALNDVEVTGTISVASGYQVNVEAANEIRILPESVTPPEMTFSIVPEIFDFSNPMPPVTNTYVSNFCEPTGNYNARRSMHAPSIDTLVIENDTNEPTFEDIFSLNLYPNPTGGNATLELTIGDRSVINLQVTDISGKPVFTAITNGIATAGVNRYELQTESLAKGIYFVHLVVNGEQHVKRLVKN